MTNIVVNIQPFVLKQKIQVFEDNKCLETLESTLDEITINCKRLYNQYGGNKIIINGNSNFISQVEKDLQTNFAKTNCIVVAY